jgi:hypothetical protein
MFFVIPPTGVYKKLFGHETLVSCPECFRAARVPHEKLFKIETSSFGFKVVFMSPKWGHEKLKSFFKINVQHK